MSGIVQFMRGLVMAALLLGAAGTLVEATGIVGREAAKAHQRGGIKFKWLNQQLVGGLEPDQPASAPYRYHEIYRPKN